jgi:2,4-dienoyl-CoA reductase-like NADH-dependent reductase (Old Yellow Enzyme family)
MPVDTERKLFTPLKIGPTTLKHRVVMAPLTRSRSIQPNSIPGNLMAEFYAQRASNGGLIIGEATNISVTSRGWLGAPVSTLLRRSRAGRRSSPMCTQEADICSRSYGTRGVPRTSK